MNDFKQMMKDFHGPFENGMILSLCEKYGPSCYVWEDGVGIITFVNTGNKLRQTMYAAVRYNSSVIINVANGNVLKNKSNRFQDYFINKYEGILNMFMIQEL